MLSKIFELFRKPETAEDPVCHMQVNLRNPPGGFHEHEGQTYYFCGAGCRVAFSKEPVAYLSGEKRMDM